MKRKRLAMDADVTAPQVVPKIIAWTGSMASPSAVLIPLGLLSPQPFNSMLSNLTAARRNRSRCYGCRDKK